MLLLGCEGKKVIWTGTSPLHKDGMCRFPPGTGSEDSDDSDDPVLCRRSPGRPEQDQSAGIFAARSLATASAPMQWCLTYSKGLLGRSSHELCPVIQYCLSDWFVVAVQMIIFWSVFFLKILHCHALCTALCCMYTAGLEYSSMVQYGTLHSCKTYTAHEFPNTNFYSKHTLNTSTSAPVHHYQKIKRTIGNWWTLEYHTLLYCMKLKNQTLPECTSQGHNLNPVVSRLSISIYVYYIYIYYLWFFNGTPKCDPPPLWIAMFWKNKENMIIRLAIWFQISGFQAGPHRDPWLIYQFISPVGVFPTLQGLPWNKAIWGFGDLRPHFQTNPSLTESSLAWCSLVKFPGPRVTTPE